jgi:beta-barrel assembly-enhancing protease
MVLKLPNAFALPGNHIVVTSGLIDMAESPDMISGVLAHELGHLDLDHPMQGLVRDLGVAATASLIFGGSGMGDIAYYMTSMSYSRDMEAEADSRALELLHEAGLKADGLAAFFELLRTSDDENNDESKDKGEDESESIGETFLSWVSTHPGLADRVEATSVDGIGAPAMNDADWQQVKKICE